jgi:subtilase family serine protease
MRWGLRTTLRTSRGFAAALAVLAAACVGPSAIAAGSSPALRVRIGHLPRLAASAKVIGALAASTPMQVTVALKPRDPAALAAFAQAVSNPASAVYREYLSPSQFAQRFGATASQLAAVESSLRAHGLNPGPASANRLSVPVRATAVQIEHAFSLSFKRLALTGGRQAVVASAAPALDTRIAGDVQAVLGLSSLSAPHPQLLRPAVLRPSLRSGLSARATPHVVTGGPQPCADATTAAQQQSAYTADHIASAYRFSSLYGQGAQGQGQTIAIYELEPNDPYDIAQYQSCYGTSAPVSYVQVGSGAGSGAGSGEAALDIENVIGLAPKASIIVYQGPNANQSTPGSGPYDVFNAIISQDRAQVVSVSWGECEQLQGAGGASAESILFQEAATQGQSIVAATGDQGSEDCNGASPLPDTSLAVDDPASQPLITGVGGTTLSSLGPPPSETVWNNGGNPTSLLPVQGGAGGGGVSQLWPMPSYQSGASGSLHVIGSNSSGSSCGAQSGYCRQVPDVSADADPNTGYLIYWNGSGSDPTSPQGWQGVGGTSAAAPLWAALLADINSSSSCRGSAIGFANPALYSAAGKAYASNFNDITQGNNDNTGTNGGLYPAGSAYDMASGLGTPNAGALASSVCGSALRVNNPGNQVSGLGQNVSLQLNTNVPAGAKLTFSASRLPTGLSISRTTGRITGKPRRRGTWTVGVTALDQTLALRSASFTWKVQGQPTVSQTSLVGAGSGRPKLALTVTAGRGAPALKGISIGLPKGLSFTRASRSVTVTGSGGKRIAFASRLVRGRLTITLATTAPVVRITAGNGAIKVTPGLAANARRNRAPTLGVSVQTTDAGRHSTALKARFKPRG